MIKYGKLYCFQFSYPLAEKGGDICTSSPPSQPQISLILSTRYPIYLPGLCCDDAENLPYDYMNRVSDHATSQYEKSQASRF